MLTNDEAITVAAHAKVEKQGTAYVAELPLDIFGERGFDFHYGATESEVREKLYVFLAKYAPWKLVISLEDVVRRWASPTQT
jgi:hypothetical protein